MFEVRVNPKKPGCDLYTIACTSDDNGFKVVSVIVVGKAECALIDCQWTKSNAHRVLAEILELNLSLKTIYISHAHPDHYFGLEVFMDEFPDAVALATPDAARTLNNQFFDKLEEWQEEIGIFNAANRGAPVTPLEGDYFEVEGEKIVVYHKVMGDLKYNTVVAIPCLSTFIGSDVLFNEAHPFTCEVTADEREQWIAELDRFQAMGFQTVIPGHAKHGLPYDEGSFNFTRNYLVATREELAACKTRDEFYYNMMQRFKNAELLRSNEMNANVLYGQRQWDWRDETVDD